MSRGEKNIVEQNRILSIEKVNAHPEKEVELLVLQILLWAFSPTNGKTGNSWKEIWRFSITMVYCNYLKEAESSSVEAQLEEEYLRWIKRESQWNTWLFLWLSRNSKCLKNFGVWGSAPSQKSGCAFSVTNFLGGTARFASASFYFFPL